MKESDTVNFPKAIIGIKPSKYLKGEVGLFALRRLSKGTIINNTIQVKERLYSLNVYDKLDEITERRVNSFCAVLYDGFSCINDINQIPLGWHCNHSCNPNCGFDEHDNIITIKIVSANSELTLDYGFVMTHSKWKMKCKCGSPNCRRVITGNDWKNSEYVSRNRKYMAVFND